VLGGRRSYIPSHRVFGKGRLASELRPFRQAASRISLAEFATARRKGERKFCEKPTDPNYLSICKLYNHVLALQENIVRPRLSS
jgi:hypothetical protein